MCVSEWKTESHDAGALTLDLSRAGGLPRDLPHYLRCDLPWQFGGIRRDPQRLAQKQADLISAG